MKISAVEHKVLLPAGLWFIEIVKVQVVFSNQEPAVGPGIQVGPIRVTVGSLRGFFGCIEFIDATDLLAGP